MSEIPIHATTVFISEIQLCFLIGHILRDRKIRGCQRLGVEQNWSEVGGDYHCYGVSVWCDENGLKLTLVTVA